jgi:hypothetical protein
MRSGVADAGAIALRNELDRARSSQARRLSSALTLGIDGTKRAWFEKNLDPNWTPPPRAEA